MDEWKKVKLGDICQTNLETYSLSEKWDFVNYLDTGSLTKNIVSEYQEIDLQNDKLPSRARRKISVNDILYSTVRPNQEHYGIVKEVVPNMLVSTGFTVISVNQELADSDFIYYCLTQREVIEHLQAIGEQSTSAYPSIKPTDIENLELFLPSLNEQREIASVLRALDDKIENNRKINHHLEKMAQAIFKSWFIDFEPFGGVKPFDWQEGVFSEIVSSTLSGDWGKENPMGNYQKMVYCMRGADLPEITFGNKGKMPVRYILPKNFTNKQLTANNIVIEISGGSPTQSTGRCALITQSLLERYECDMVCTNFCRAIKPKEGYSEFIYYYWRYLYEHNVMFLYENGTTGIKNLDISSFLENEKIIIPTLNSVHKFSNIVQKLRNTIATNGLEIEKLTNLRDTLLPKLLSGEISVNQVTK